MTIETLLGKSAAELAALTDDELKIHLADAINLEPKSKPPIIGGPDKPKKSRKNQFDLEVDDEPDNPIKRKKKKLTGMEMLIAMQKELKELGIVEDEE